MRAVLIMRQGEGGGPTGAAIHGLEGVLQVLGLSQRGQLRDAERGGRGHRGGSLRLT
ncbi:MAG: hypothetical protein ACRELD_01535 [Longimicrobiales bacterium]